MKKLASLVLSAAMLFSLAACTSGDAQGNEPAEEENPPAVEEETTEQPAQNSDVVYSVGIIQQMEHQSLDDATQGFMAALTEHFGEDGVKFDYQNAQGEKSNCNTIVAKFIADDVDLIMANATTALQTAASATGTIPIVGTSITDYVSAGVIESNDAPGGNVTGASDLSPIDAQIDLLTMLCPDAQTVGIFYCSAEANSLFQAEKAKEALDNVGIASAYYTFSDSNDMQAVLTNMLSQVDAIYIPTDNTAAENMSLVQNITVPAGIPVIVGAESMCADGALASLSISYYSMGYEAGLIAIDILENGADPATTPIAYSTVTTPKYNPSIAADLGWTIPDGLEPIEN